MSVYLEDPDVTLYHGDALEVLRGLPDESVHMCVTSPPFFGLRDYQTGWWEGGDGGCDHTSASLPIDDRTLRAKQNEVRSDAEGVYAHPTGWEGGGRATSRTQGQTCGKCGARRVDQQIGLEETPDEWVERLVAVFREVRRVLRPDGTLWVEVGDSYSGGGGFSPDAPSNLVSWTAVRGNRNASARFTSDKRRAAHGCKQKDLIGAPWKLAEALKAPYYTGEIKAERDRIWLAATLDAEGSMSGHRHTRKDDGSIRTGVHVTITNTCAAMLDEANRIWPASRIQHDGRDGSLGQRECWRWVATNVTRNSLLMRELYPYLIAKKHQAMLAYNLYELSQVSKRIRNTREGEQARAKRDWIVGAISDLNHGATVDMPGWIVEPPSVLEPGWYLRSEIIWAKPNPMPESVSDRPTTAHSRIFLLAKSPRYFMDMEAIREPHESTRWGGPIAKNTEDWKYRNGGELVGVRERDGREFYPEGGRNARSVWTLATEPFPGAHFAVWPTKLVARMITAGCPERGTVLDPFVGSGTTCFVARKLGRRAIGVDLNAGYLEMASRRLAQQSLFAVGP